MATRQKSQKHYDTQRHLANMFQHHSLQRNFYRTTDNEITAAKCRTTRTGNVLYMWNCDVGVLLNDEAPQSIHALPSAGTAHFRIE